MDLQQEIISLHFRKALEEMAFSSLCANVEIYSRTHERYASYRQVKRLLKEIADMNPNFFPVAISGHDQPVPERTAENGLTLPEFEELYSCSCAALHSPNPYRAAPEPGSRYSVNEWLERFRNLLAVHRIQLLEREEAWIVIVPRHGDISVGVERLIELPTQEYTLPGDTPGTS